MSALTLLGDPAKDDKFTRYHAEIQVHDKLIGGIPKDADTIKKWLASRIEGGNDLVLQELVNETVAEMAEASGAAPGPDELLNEVARRTEGGNGFKSVDGQLVYEGRCMKAALKEAANIAYPGTQFPGKPKDIRKGLHRFMAETVFVEDRYIPLGVSAPSGTEQRIKHIFVTGKGKQGTINIVDYVEKPLLSFTVAVRNDFLPQSGWLEIWQTLEYIGIGADRARSDGQFELITWDRV